MEDFIPYNKRSKKEKRKADREKRQDWGNINPTTRVVPDKHKKKKQDEIEKSRKEF